MDLFIQNEQEMQMGKFYADIETAILKVLNIEGHFENVEVSLTFVTNEQIRELNREYRGIDHETDVLSFPIDDSFDVDGPLLLGDIVISVEKAVEQAADFGHSLKREILYLVVHSMLHLLGYDHIEETDAVVMRALEKKIMNELRVYK